MGKEQPARPRGGSKSMANGEWRGWGNRKRRSSSPIYYKTFSLLFSSSSSPFGWHVWLLFFDQTLRESGEENLGARTYSRCRVKILASPFTTRSPFVRLLVKWVRWLFQLGITSRDSITSPQRRQVESRFKTRRPFVYLVLFFVFSLLLLLFLLFLPPFPCKRHPGIESYKSGKTCDQHRKRKKEQKSQLQFEKKKKTERVAVINSKAAGMCTLVVTLSTRKKRATDARLLLLSAARKGKKRSLSQGQWRSSY